MPGSTRSYEMAKRLVKMGHEVTIITSQTNAGKEGATIKTNEDGICVYWLAVPYSNSMSYNRRIMAFIKFAYESYKTAITIPADLIFASSTPLTIALPGVYAARKLKVPFVFEVRDLWPDLPIAVGAIRNGVLKKLAYRLEKFAYVNSDAIVALSDGMKKGIMSTGYPGNKISVIPNASDLERFDPLKPRKRQLREQYGIPKDAIVILYAGTFGVINGVEYLMKLAAEFINDKRIFFLTVGGGQQFEFVKNVAVTNGTLGRNVLMFEKVSKIEVSAFFECAEMAISTVIPLPELEANCANKFFDALAAGCCMVINHKGWQAELLESSGAGFSLSFDITTAKKELQEWLNEPRKIFQAGKIARDIAEKMFDRNILAQQLEAELIKVYEQKKDKLNQHHIHL
ncbi:glycosyltransferase family 4 protein [Sediminibacterium ginsengisoli]|uniref:Glycosyltransferase involved in cell wall bisynthesis n=1 Tax=Sediminibacterium ginsengisoli TaxID=413434 RepID=A0A1T4N571_9BACT|nr:glycosyltransferase family 4 protein [Sediminibacterium ginsengisoli]SJZ74135.1 Glycosyltransferase involved in cell wall bisynthesis [Sediminibacterium ginsengisoli]